MRLISVSVFWNIIRAVTTLETMYNDSLKFFTQLVMRLQVCNFWITQHMQKVKKNNAIIAEDSI